MWEMGSRVAIYRRRRDTFQFPNGVGPGAATGPRSGQALAQPLSGRCQATGRQYQVDDRPRKCISRPAERRDGRSAAHAQEGIRRGQPEVIGTAEGRNQGCREQAGNHSRAGESGSSVRAQLQPDGRLRSAGLPVSTDCLPAAGLLCGGHGHLVWCGNSDGSGLGRWLGLQLRMGRQQQRDHQQQQQLRQ